MDFKKICPMKNKTLAAMWTTKILPCEIHFMTLSGSDPNPNLNFKTFDKKLSNLTI